MDLVSFGKQLQKQRKALGLTQEALGERIAVSAQSISFWERAYQHNGRQWKPDRSTVLRLIGLFAQRLTPGEAQTWAAQAEHYLTQAELQTIFPTYWANRPVQLPPLTPFYTERPQIQQFIINQLDHTPALALVGPGGTGKTTLATWAAHTLAPQFPDGLIWVEGLVSNDVTEAQRWIGRSFGVMLLGQTPAERAAELRTILHDRQCLLILDDIWASPDLAHLQVTNRESCTLLTTRDAKVANMLNIPLLWVGSLTPQEGQALLRAWIGHDIDAAELITRLGGLPLAISLSGAQLRLGNVTLTGLLTHFCQAQVDLSLLDQDDPKSRAESLRVCFDLSYRRLRPKERQRFAQLSCFVGSFEERAVAAVWGVGVKEARSTLQRLRRFALLEQGERGYHLHPLLRDYTREQLAVWPDLAGQTYRRHATWFIRYSLYHPGVIEGTTEPAPSLDHTWSDVVAGLRWAAEQAPELAAQAVLLAHTERPALLEAVGSELIRAIERYIPTLNNHDEQGLFHELLGDLYLLEDEFVTGLNQFLQAAEHWALEGNWLDGSRAIIRAAGVYLLCQNAVKAAETAREAQSWLAKALPMKPEETITAKWLFYWFDILYNALVRWPELPEVDVINLAQLGEQTEQAILTARGLHIYRLWCTVEDIPRSDAIRAQGRELAVRAYYQWRACDRMDQADDEISFAQYQLNRRYSRRTAARYARRRSQSTPAVSLAQIKLAKNEAVRWWLGATESQRVDWFSRMAPRYLGACNSAKPVLKAGSRAWHWIKDILTISVLGGEGRILMKPSQVPANHILNGPEWLALTGRRVRPLASIIAANLISRYLNILEINFGCDE